MTNPQMYEVIDTKRGVRKTYTEALIGRGDISMKEAEDALRDYQGQLERVFNEVRDLEKYQQRPSESVEEDQQLPQKLVTAVDKALLQRIGDAFLSVPEDFSVHPRVKPVLDKRREMAYEGKVDWAFGELLAFGTLVAEGKVVRLSGQDSKRGTFTQRHAVIIDRHNGTEFSPLQLVGVDAEGNPTGGRLVVHDSALSEYAALGFEYGYSVGNPDAMVLWEAQFGDFVNGAQSIIDEFISSGEAKWGQLSEVVLLLPTAMRAGSRPHLGPHRAVPAAVRRRLDDGGHAVDARQLLPPIASACPGRHHPANGGVHAKVHAAQQGCGQ